MKQIWTNRGCLCDKSATPVLSRCQGLLNFSLLASQEGRGSEDLGIHLSGAAISSSNDFCMPETRLGPQRGRTSMFHALMCLRVGEGLGFSLSSFFESPTAWEVRARSRTHDFCPSQGCALCLQKGPELSNSGCISLPHDLETKGRGRCSL